MAAADMALKIFGALLVVLPFVALAVMIARETGWSALARAYGMTVAFVVAIGAGVYLMGVPL